MTNTFGTGRLFGRKKLNKTHNCWFIASSGSMGANGRMQAVADLAYQNYNFLGAEAMDVYCNDEGRIHFLGTIKSGHSYGEDMVFFPHGGSEDWVNAGVIAGLADTYKHLFYVEDGEGMIDVLVRAVSLLGQETDKIEGSSGWDAHEKITGICIRSAGEERTLRAFVDNAAKRGIRMKGYAIPYSEDIYSAKVISNTEPTIE